MRILNRIINIAAPPPDIETFDRFLFVGPHPDDIEIGAGATAAKLAASGKTVKFLICIDGRFGDGHCELKGQALVEKRQEESKASAEMLGVKDVAFLGYCDGGQYNCEDLKKDIAKEIGNFNPDVVFCPDPCVTSECHIDHLNVGNIVRSLACFAPYSGIMENYGAKKADVKALAYYMTAKPNKYVKTTGFLQKQLDSVFGVHLSQFPEGCDDAKSITLYLKLRAYDFGLRKGSRTAEGFRVLGPTQMHCLPEAGE